jgi:glycosyltransferase involved in cell wall biosynthesis
MTREEYAERLKDCAIVLYTDEIAGFGTLPLEAMASGTHVVGFSPFGGKEYINQSNGFWSANGDVFQVAEFLGIASEKWLSGELDHEDFQKSYEETLSRYTVEKEKESILKIYQEYITERIDEIGKL